MARLRVLLACPFITLLLLCSVACPGVKALSEASHEATELPSQHDKRYGSGQDYWYSQIKRQGTAPYQLNSTYQIFRNVKDYGAMGDGITDDTDAINNATFDGRNCIYPCDSSSTTPAILYFPSGTYMVSRPLVMTYYTQFVGDANALPVLKATPDFFGIAILDSDPYLAYGYNWYQNQNNFWRQVRNFVLDITLVPAHSQQAYCLHWQVAQATSLQNIVFKMVEGGDDNTQMGIFMDNGSGGWIEDLIFIGGNVGFFSGNQQFTCRNLTFMRCNTAIYQNWNWVFNYKDINIIDCNIGLDMTQGGSIITTGSLVLQDAVITNTNIGILTTFASNSTPVAAGSLVLDNVNFDNTPVGMAYPNGTTVLDGNQRVASFIQGNSYSAYEDVEEINDLTCYQPSARYGRVQQVMPSPPKPASLLDENGNFYIRSKPQYEGVPVSSFKSSFDFGCIGDGVSDDTQCIQDFFDSIGPSQIAFVNHGAYVIRDTILIPNNIKIVGEIWPLFMVDGSSSTFDDMSNPKPAFRVGQPGESGAVELSELLFETLGPAPGAIMMEWNLAHTAQRSNGMWDVHWRIGGTNGTKLQSNNCAKTPNQATVADPSCIGAFLLTHITSTGQVLMSNNWGWVSDHELDLPDHAQINLYNGRGLLIESQGPVWLYGSSYEHSVLYNYQIANAKEIYLGIIQSETAYMQNNPDSLTPFPPSSKYSDPDFADCYLVTCYKTMAVRFFNSTFCLVYGAGLYSFFNNYDSGCLLTGNCQQNIVSLEQSEAIYMYALNTVGSENMVEVDSVEIVPQAANKNGFCQTVVLFEYP
ncbi:hypothetical protein AAFC00_000972 [Neodothiora populina]|uniref:Rhamnogalacturonase A/B/Epimerase-like pectate lyase domain-containing protein n=1 Tax=Neodothiora populina TaxID=2781224 RepID=A0ABR3PME9_9PEZI